MKKVSGMPAVLSNVFVGGSLAGSISWCDNVSADIRGKRINCWKWSNVN